MQSYTTAARDRLKKQDVSVNRNKKNKHNSDKSIRRQVNVWQRYFKKNQFKLSRTKKKKN